MLASSPDTFLPAATKTVPSIQDHQGYSHSSSSGHLFVISSLVGPSSTDSNLPLKRQSDSEGNMQCYLPYASYLLSKPSAPHTSKRRRIESDFLARLSRSKQDSLSSSGRRSQQQASVSEPDQVEDSELTDPASEDILSPSLGQFPIHSRRRDRSQTAPEPSIHPGSESVLIPQAIKPLRRHQSSPLEHRKASSAQLDALQRAYAIITDTGTSQIDVQDIMHARRLANQINQVLDEQMCLKFGACRDGSP